ncbi:UDP-N-acetylmuramoyl-tripeptide--D-alanyl-D-alanine ligase [Candidatus Parcubacteria bacterium]|nr:UDP-N-acetylmuramoyl-tripeptide--D-alanyl-D-alanine ligase [Candidatus Parcubacteria bacterium]
MKETIKGIVIYILSALSRGVLRRYQPKIVAVTGTVGKTSTKDAIYFALTPFVSVRKSPKSFNSELGVPLTILGQRNPANNPLGWIKAILDGIGLLLLPNHYPEWLVLEVGTDRPGDITALTRWLKPDMVVVTKLSKVPVHVEAFANPEDLFREKGRLVQALKPGGTLILNSDDEDVLRYKNLSDENIILFGNGNGSDISATGYEILYDENKMPTGINFAVTFAGEEDKPLPAAILGTVGQHNMYQVLAALAVVRAMGEDVDYAASALRRLEPARGRMRIIEGIKSVTILDDTYNSSPVALEEALKTLKSIKATRKIAVLGDMLELGRFSLEEHKKAGERVKKSAGVLLTVGVRSRAMVEGALSAGMDEGKIFQFDDSREAGKFLEQIMKRGDLVLVKGSQGMRMERVVEEVMLHPEEKEKLLARQDKEWQRRG